MRTSLKVLAAALSVALCPAVGRAAPASVTVTVTGLVRRPLSLTVGDLAKLSAVPVRINDVRGDGSYHGAFSTQGVPLRSLLELAGIQKEAGAFPRPLDLAIVVRDREGKTAALSWGEVFYKNPGSATLAFSTAPIMPHKDCKACHPPSLYKPLMDQLARPVALPKLVMADDFGSDRALEGVVNVEVVDLKPDSGPWPVKKGDRFSPQMTVSGGSKKALTVKDLSGFPRARATVNVVGDGKGFHGRYECEGAPLVDVLARAGVKADLRTVFVASGFDGYRVLISYGELYLSPLGRRILVVDRRDGAPLEKDGRFAIVFPDDQAADRDVKSVERIEAVRLEVKPKVYIIGMGPGDTDLVTREAVSALAKTDAVVAPAELYRTHSALLADKPFLGDSMNLVHKRFYAKDHPEIPAAQLDARFEAARKELAAKIREKLSQGQSVAFLDWGDPLIFGSSRWIRNQFSDGEIVTVPSLSAFNVSNAVLGRDVTCNGSAILTVPARLRADESLLTAVAKHGDTLVIFIGLREFKDLLPLFRKHYAETTPVAIVYNAGMSGRQRTVTGTLKDILGKTTKDQEEFLGLIYVGPCLAEKATECQH
jgi:precorrin-4 methylase